MRRSVAAGGPRCYRSARGFVPSPQGHKSEMATASWSAPASAKSVAQLRQAVADFADEHGVTEPCLSDIRLAVSEAVSNAVIHAFRGREHGTVIASVTTSDGEWIEVRVTDDGSGMAPRDDSPGMGLGL